MKSSRLRGGVAERSELLVDAEHLEGVERLEFHMWGGMEEQRLEERGRPLGGDGTRSRRRSVEEEVCFLFEPRVGREGEVPV